MIYRRRTLCSALNLLAATFPSSSLSLRNSWMSIVWSGQRGRRIILTLVLFWRTQDLGLCILTRSKTKRSNYTGWRGVKWLKHYIWRKNKIIGNKLFSETTICRISRVFGTAWPTFFGLIETNWFKIPLKSGSSLPDQSNKWIKHNVPKWMDNASP